MIFRRSNNSAPSRNTAKNPMANTPRNQTQASVNSGQNPNLTNRREPAFGSGMNTQDQPMAITPPLNPSHNNSTSAPPVSPLAMAQARRNPNGPAPAGFARQDQVRKLTVGREISLNGEIGTCDHLVVEGSVNATVKDGQVLEILEKGSFSGLVDIEQADIAGKFDGELTVRGKLVIRSTATVTGTIRYGSLQVDHGAVMNGQITTLPKQNMATTTFSATTETQTTSQNTQPSLATNNLHTSAGTSATMQQNTDLSSVLDQPGFLKASGQ